LHVDMSCVLISNHANRLGNVVPLTPEIESRVICMNSGSRRILVQYRVSDRSLKDLKRAVAVDSTRVRLRENCIGSREGS